jgi:hypothetical protein
VGDRILELTDKIEIKEKNRRTVSKTTQYLWKEYAITHQHYQKTKPGNMGIEEVEEVQPKRIGMYLIK